MKTVYANNNELCHAWAHQLTSYGRNSGNSLFFRDTVLFSYGEHFPLAKLFGSWVINNPRQYSVTTSKHKGYAWKATSHLHHIEMADVLNPLNDANLKWWVGRLNDLKDQATKRRGIHRKRWDIETFRRLSMAVGHFYAGFYSEVVEDNEELLNALSDARVEPPEWAEWESTVDEEIAKQLAIQEERGRVKRERLLTIALPLWRDGQTIPNGMSIQELMMSTGKTYLRRVHSPDGVIVETSKGIRLSTQEAITALLAYKRGSLIGHQLQGYTITHSTPEGIKAGCHTIDRSEIDYIASQLGVSLT